MNLYYHRPELRNIAWNNLQDCRAKRMGGGSWRFLPMPVNKTDQALLFGLEIKWQNMAHGHMAKRGFLLCGMAVSKLSGSVFCPVLCVILSLAVFWVCASCPGPKLCQDPCKLLKSPDICGTVLSLGPLLSTTKKKKAVSADPLFLHPCSLLGIFAVLSVFRYS